MNAPISSNGFNLQPANLDEAMNLATMLANSSMVPKNYKNQKEDTLVAMMMGSELGLNPIQALQNIAVINGKPSIYGDALLALVQNHPAFGSIQEVFDETAYTATCTVQRKNGHPHTVVFSKADAEKAGLWGKQGPWTQYPKRMMQMRARGFALRDQFADALLGLITAEEAEDMPDEINITPAKPIRDALPSTYPQDKFDANLPVWGNAIKSGNRTADEIIALVSTKGVLTADQQKVIKSINPEKAA
ncbi:MAG: recombinase RecT [Cycloclasticus sp.]|nr:recombinase RecT [Cycloclasticus sp.]